MKHITENNQYEKSISSEMLNFCPLCVAEVYQNGYPIFKFSHFVYC